MRILYLTYFSFLTSNECGVLKKIKSQIKALEGLGYTATLMGLGDSSFSLKEGENITTFECKACYNKRKTIYFILKKLIDIQNYDIVYIRLPGFIDSYFFKTLKFLKRKNKKILLEIPTYPLNGELKNNLKNYLRSCQLFKFLTRCVAYSLHFVYIRMVKKYIDKIITFMPYEKIWGIDVVCIDNGVELEECKLIEKENHEGINLIIVANLAKWHGVDRLIAGLKDYYDNNVSERVFLTIVGETELIGDLKQYAHEKEVYKYCKFVGRKDGELLRQEYSTADVAVGSLGMHRIGVLNGSTIKVKEYCALGLPFIYAYNERLIKENFKYALKLKMDESPVDISQVVDFYKGLKMTKRQALEMRSFAEEFFSWKKQMAYVVQNLEID